MTTVAITGAAGFIGRQFAAALSPRCKTLGLDLQRYKGICDEWATADIGRGLPRGILSGIDTIFHLAGKVHALAEVQADELAYFRINTEGTRNVLTAAKEAGVKRFVFFSTIKAMSRDGDAGPTSEGGEQRTEVRGQGAENGGLRSEDGYGAGERPMTEEDSVEPDTPYGKSKLEAEELVLNGGYVPEPVVLRLCMVYGAGAKGNMQKMLQAVARGRFPPIPEVGNRRSMVHVKDVVQAALLAAEKPEAVGQRFIVSDGQAYSTRQMYELICHALAHGVPRWSLPLWSLRLLGVAGDAIGRLRGRRFTFDSDALQKLIGSAWFSSRKIESVLGFQPAWDLEKALPEMVTEMRAGDSPR